MGIQEFLNEKVKNFLTQPEDKTDKLSSQPDIDNTLMDLTNIDMYPNTGAFFDGENSMFTLSDVSDILQKQKLKIMQYRQLAKNVEVSDALDEIVNEIIFSFDEKIPLKLNINQENKKIEKKIQDSFDKILNLIDVRRNLFQIVKRSYVDGQIILHCAYDKTTTNNGLKSIKMIEPCMLYLDKDGMYKYLNTDKQTYYNSNETEMFSIEEIIKEDFGLYDNKVNLGYLEYAIKPANILQTLEDLLIPMRFSRSISRRVFNVDVGDLPVKRAAEVMNEYQTKFKYKKFYNNEDGTVTNQQHITSMVEDYWFSNRSGGKGTQVDTIDETGNLGELDDILYFNRKLYKALKIPSNRINSDPDADHDFDYDSTRVSKEDMKFFMFISRIRQVYIFIFRELLKRELVSTNVLSEKEWGELEADIEIYFINENSFIEKLKLDNLTNKFSLYGDIQEYQGKVISVEKILKEVFKFSDEEIKENFEQIEKEKKDPFYKDFYSTEEDPKW